MINYNDCVDVVSRTVWGEARGEGQVGMHAVANVIMNRAKVAREHINAKGTRHPLFGRGSLTEVCLAPSQFSCWAKYDPNFSKMEAISDETDRDGMFDLAQRIAGLACMGELESIVGNCRHYLTEKLYHSEACPKWAKKMRLYRVFGNHVFLDEV